MSLVDKKGRPIARDPLGLRDKFAKLGGGSKVVKTTPAGETIASPAPAPDMIVGQRNVDVFWEHLPWGRNVNYFQRQGAILAAALVAGLNRVETYVVPRGFVIGITSVVFRAYIPLGTGLKGLALARDDFFVLEDANAVNWLPKIGDGLITDVQWIFPFTGAVIPGYFLLNTDIATPEVPFVVFANEGQQFTVDVNVPVPGTVTDLGTFSLAAEWRAVWIPKALFETMKAKFMGRV